MTSNTAIDASYVYDAENRLIWSNTNSNAYLYIYDGDGERVEKCAAASATTPCPTSGTTGTLYWRGMGSDPLAETDLAGNVLNNYVFFGGQRVARHDSAGAVHYYFSDHLGTHAVVENAAGTACEQDIDYYPYGGEEHDYCTTSVAQNYKFNGKERDAESGLDNFGARYNTSNLGRFMTPDWAAKPVSVPYANFGNPQSLNLYAYTENNPTTLGDPDGHLFSCENLACMQAGLQEESQSLGGGWHALFDPAMTTLLKGDEGTIANQAVQGSSSTKAAQTSAQNKGFWWNVGHALGVVSTPQEKAFRAAIMADMKAHPEQYPVSQGIVYPMGPLGKAASRAAELAGTMGKTKGFVTIAVTETEEGVNVVSSSENALRPGVRAALGEGEVAAEGAGHAEQTGVNAAKEMGLNPTGTAASRGICPSCAEFLHDLGVAALSWFKP
jgi:RHS repeat-associated protein